MKTNRRSPSYDFFRRKILKFLALADAAIQRASVRVKQRKGGLDADVKKIQSILQKKIIRLDFFVSFLGDATAQHITISNKK